MSENASNPAAPSNPTTTDSIESSENDESGEQNLDLSSEDDSSESQQPTIEEKKQIAKLKKLKIKFNGKEMEEELPFEIDDTPENRKWFEKQLQLAKLSTHSTQEKAQLEKEVRAFIEELRKNPKKALANPHIGVDVKALAKEILEEEFENSKKSPEQLKIEEYERKLKEIEEARKLEEDERRQQEYEAVVEREYERYDMLMSQALEKSDLPKSPYVIKKMTDYMIMGLQEGMDINPADVLPIVREEIMNDIKEMFGAMPLEVMEQIIGGDNLNKLRKKRLATKTPPANPLKQVKDVAGKSDSKPSTEDKKSFRDFFGV